MGRLKKVDPKYFTEEDYNAVDAGVEKWKAFVAEGRYSYGSECSLCQLSYKRWEDQDKEGHFCSLCVLGEAHGVEDNCISHYHLMMDDPKSKKAKAILQHLRNIRDQIKKGMDK